MTGCITVKRTDHPERTRTVNRKTGKTVVVPAHYECWYYWNGKEIAHYTSTDDIVYLRTDYLARPLSLPYAERMEKAPCPEMWADLVAFLDINKDTALSEYTYA